MGDWELVRGADREIDRFSARDDDLERRVHAFWVGEREIWHSRIGQRGGVDARVEWIRSRVGVSGTVRGVED